MRRYELEAHTRFGMAVGIPFGGAAHDVFGWLGVGASALLALLVTSMMYVIERRAALRANSSGGSPS